MNVLIVGQSPASDVQAALKPLVAMAVKEGETGTITLKCKGRAYTGALHFTNADVEFSIQSSEDVKQASAAKAAPKKAAKKAAPKKAAPKK